MGPALAAGLVEAWLSTSSGWVPTCSPQRKGLSGFQDLPNAPASQQRLSLPLRRSGDESCPFTQAGEILKDWALTSQQFSLKESPLNWKGFSVFSW